jgi:hypothetical protein
VTSFTCLPKSSLEIRVDEGEVVAGEGTVDGVDESANEPVPEQTLPTETPSDTPVKYVNSQTKIEKL